MKATFRWSFISGAIVYMVAIISFFFLTDMNRSDSIFVSYLIIPIFAYFGVMIFYEMKKVELDKINWMIFWFVSIVIRTTILLFPVGLSDDVYRYMWDGRVQHAGINPYKYSPNDSSVEFLRTGWWSMINNSDVSTPYPPFAQIIFYLLGFFGYDVEIMTIVIRFMMLVVDLGITIIIKKLIMLFNIPNRRVLWYGWSPLAVFEYAGNGHIDGIAVFLSLLAIYLILTASKDNTNELISAIILPLAILTKFFPIVLTPFFLKVWNDRERLVFIFTTVVVGLPYVSVDVFPWFSSGVVEFTRIFNFNESIFRVFVLFFSYISSSGTVITRILYISITVVILLYYFNQWDRKNIRADIVSIANHLLLFGLLFGPNVQPWYLLWVLPYSIVIFDIAVILLSGLVLYSYHIYVSFDSGGVWHENPWILLLQYIPVYVIVIYQWYKGKYSIIRLNPVK